MKLLLALLAGTALVGAARAETTPTPVASGECRVRKVPYTNDIIVLHVPARGSTMVILSPQETTGDVNLSNGEWQAASSGNTFIVVPTVNAPATDVHVVSALPDGTFRTYSFLLTVAPGGIELPSQKSDRIASNSPATPVATDAAAALPPPDCNRPDMPFASVKIVYPASMLPRVGRKGRLSADDGEDADQSSPSSRAPATAPLYATSAARKRCDFKWRGSPSLLPLSACDTGTQTTFYWPGQVPVPGIFMIQADGSEASVNAAPDPAMPGWVVVNNTSPFWSLRMGVSLVAELNDAAYNPTAVASPSALPPLASQAHLHCYHSRHYVGQRCYRPDGTLAQAPAGSAS